jgi:2-C-methyl-D-erythritol 4-phosphate cytidylyltransferase
VVHNNAAVHDIDTPRTAGESWGDDTWAIVLAAGEGARFGGHKQYATVAGQPMVAWSCAAAAATCRNVILVTPAAQVSAPPPAGVSHVVAGGATRNLSVLAGLAAVPQSAGAVIVHDAAHPAATKAIFHQILRALHADPSAAAVVPVIPVNETLVWVTSRDTIDAVAAGRGTMQVQMPQVFRAAALRRAVAGAPRPGLDEASMLATMGETVMTVPGDVRNMHITKTSDLATVSSLLGDGEDPHHND